MKHHLAGSFLQLKIAFLTIEQGMPQVSIVGGVQHRHLKEFDTKSKLSTGYGSQRVQRFL